MRPPDEPGGDDPRPPYYLATDTPRGPWFVCAFEWWQMYNWVRVGDPRGASGVALAANIAQRKAYLRACGHVYTG